MCRIQNRVKLPAQIACEVQHQCITSHNNKYRPTRRFFFLNRDLVFLLLIRWETIGTGVQSVQCTNGSKWFISIVRIKKKECRTSLLKWCILGQALVKSQESCYLLWFSIFLVASNNKGQNEIWWCYSWILDKIPAWRCWGIKSKPKLGLVKTSQKLECDMFTKSRPGIS